MPGEHILFGRVNGIAHTVFKPKHVISVSKSEEGYNVDLHLKSGNFPTIRIYQDTFDKQKAFMDEVVEEMKKVSTSNVYLIYDNSIKIAFHEVNVIAAVKISGTFDVKVILKHGGFYDLCCASEEEQDALLKEFSCIMSFP